MQLCIHTIVILIHTHRCMSMHNYCNNVHIMLVVVYHMHICTLYPCIVLLRESHTVGPVFIARLNYCVWRFAEAFANLIVAIDLQIRSL